MNDTTIRMEYYTEDIFGCINQVYAVKKSPTEDDIEAAVDKMWQTESGFTFEVWIDDNIKDIYHVSYIYEDDLCTIQLVRIDFVNHSSRKILERADVSIEDTLSTMKSLVNSVDRS